MVIIEYRNYLCYLYNNSVNLKLSMNSKELFWLFKYYSFSSESLSCPVVSDSATPWTASNKSLKNNFQLNYYL